MTPNYSGEELVLFGSIERFFAILLEHYAGVFPVWLSPVQVVVANISEAQAGYAVEVADQLRQAGLRVDTDLRGEKINYKIRENSLQKIPYLLVVGDKERQAGKVAVRARGGADSGVLDVGAFAARLSEDVALKRSNPQ